jgi:hypothetical protein
MTHKSIPHGQKNDTRGPLTKPIQNKKKYAWVKNNVRGPVTKAIHNKSKMHG